MANQLGLTLPLQRGPSGYFQTATDVLTQVKSDLTNLLLTRRGERIMQPLFGCELSTQVFEFENDDDKANITGIIQTAINDWLPFLKLNNVDVTNDSDNNQIFVTVQFTLITNNVTDEITLSFS